MFNIDLNLGKYTIILDEDYKLTALRYGQPWRDLTGDGLVMSMAQRIEDDKMLILRLRALLQMQERQLYRLGTNS